MRRGIGGLVAAGLSVVLVSAAVASMACAQAPAARDADRFFASVAALCGKAFAGRIVANEPTPVRG